MRNPIKVSIIIITWNSQLQVAKCLKYINDQSFNHDSMEIIVVDGGSADNTLKICADYRKKFKNFQIMKTKIVDQEPKRAIGALAAKGEYICSIDPDVYIRDKNWLNQMIEPLEKDSTLTGSQTLYYEYDKNESLINRYFALFGINDPVVYYLNKADRIAYFDNTWKFNRDFIDRGSYFEVKFDEEIPTMGCNGVIYRRKNYISAGIEPDSFFHIDVIQDIVRKGHNKYAIVKNSSLHSTGSTFWKSIGKRIAYMRLHYYEKKNVRRYLVYNPAKQADKKNLMKFVFFTITIFQPLYLSMKGFIRKPDPAWFLHYPMCLGFLYAYGIATIKNKFS